MILVLYNEEHNEGVGSIKNCSVKNVNDGTYFILIKCYDCVFQFQAISALVMVNQPTDLSQRRTK